MTVVEPDSSDVRRWIERSLKAGQAVSTAVLERAVPDGRGASRLWVSEGHGAAHLPAFEEGGVAKASEATAWLVEEIEGMVVRGARCLVVEDSLSRPSDPAVTRSRSPASFLGESVFAWCDLLSSPGPALLDKVIRAGGGYPTNAFVVSTPSSALGLRDRQEVPVAFPEAVAASVEAVIVSAHDDETYLLWDANPRRRQG